MFPARSLVAAFACTWLLTLAAFAQGADPFSAGVRTTEPLTPEQQLKTFHLPPGFEMQLVTTEPHINKPMNMAFDAAGRLWVTTSIEYPFASTNALARDRIMIFEDFAPDGRARKITQFATGLNIPIGIYPFQSPSSVKPSKLTWKCIAWSIPHIWLMEDTDGDGKADKQEPLYGAFDHTRDTHGNQASFRRGFDGWLYATHGFSNNSKVRGKDGHEIEMSSGNTYRMRLNGDRLENHTFGQVNPFGLCFDPQGNLYSADCHSSPIYQLLRGAYYPSFGKPHDGLGFAPVTIQHSHGSTAICGIQMITDPSWPKELQGNLIIGNVMTSRINQDRVEWLGSTSKGQELPDFLRSDDPWFRPVDLQFGPDGALYVADFYNRIIGHYEVPLQHPGRDRERGRIWRIVYHGEDGKAVLPDAKLPEDLKGLVAELGSPNMTRRMLAMNAIADTQGKAFARKSFKAPWLESKGKQALAQDAAAYERSAEVLQYVHALWLRERLEVLKDKELVAALQAPVPLVKVHALRILAERGLFAQSRSKPGKLESIFLQPLVTSLSDSSALVQRTAVEVLAQYTMVDSVKPLLTLLAGVPPEDTHLKHMARMAVRNQLAGAGAWVLYSQKDFVSGAELNALMDVLLGVRTPAAASFLLRHQSAVTGDPGLKGRILQHIARYAPLESLDAMAVTMQEELKGDMPLQLEVFQTVQRGFEQRGQKLPPGLHSWGTFLTANLLAEADKAAVWGNTPLEGSRDPGPWTLQERECSDGKKVPMISSFPLGERLTGTLRSAPFVIPPRLSFYLCGHDGFPTSPLMKKNFFRLRDAATGAVLVELSPPRADQARQSVLQIATHQGRLGYIEVVDGNPQSSYAWLAFGRFEPALPQLALADPAQTARYQRAAAELARNLGLKHLQPRLISLLNSMGDYAARVEAATTLAAFNGDRLLSAMVGVLNDPAMPEEARQSLLVAFGAERSAARPAVENSLQQVPTRVQQKLALMLAGIPEGAELLLALAESGKLPVRVIANKGVQDKLAAAQWQTRLTKLTAGLPPDDALREKLIMERRTGFTGAKANAFKGKEIFTAACAACHQVKGQGSLVGPQLDGIASRGAERVIEDILDPNRNVDHAFRSHTIVLKDGEVTTGLPRREEGETLVIANAAGQEVSIPKREIKERKESTSSLMPDNFGEALTPEQLYDLLAYLLQQR